MGRWPRQRSSARVMAAVATTQRGESNTDRGAGMEPIPRYSIVGLSDRTRVWQCVRSKCLLAALAFAVIGGSQSFADEGGVSFWLPGEFGSLAAAPQVPGWAFGIINIYESEQGSGAVAASREITINKFNAAVNVNLNLNLAAHADLVLVSPTYVFATPVFGGQLAVGVAGAAGRSSADLNGTLTVSAGGLTATRQGEISDARYWLRRSLSAGIAPLEQRCQFVDGLWDGRHSRRHL
jgi:hypothetical protein